MYKLVYFKAVNLIGFMSGLSKKSIEIDLSEFYDLDIILCVGANATGKSTFLSLVHPSPYPTNGKRKFVIKEKEGLLVRKYRSADGTVITTKCIYKPKKSGGHNASCYFEIKKPKEDAIELNPNGNVTSYEELLYTYFGINKDFLSFATFSTDVASIVRMTDTERKDSIGTLVPNTKRFEVGYNLINDKYKDLRTLIRNLSQQILSLRDEDSLEADLKRLTKELQKFAQDREDKIRQLGTLEGKLQELTKGESINALVSNYEGLLASALIQGNAAAKSYKSLMKLYEQLGIEPVKEQSIVFDGIDMVPYRVLKYERKALNCAERISQHGQRKEELIKELSVAEKEAAELESSLFSIQTEDIEELRTTRRQYEEELASLRYTKEQDRYTGMSYDEVVSFSQYIGPINQMVQALYDEYGQLVSDYFDSSNWDEFTQQQRYATEQLAVTIEISSKRKDEIYQKLIQSREYAKLSDILKMRPVSCTIDTCPFIAEPLKWSNVADDITQLEIEYQQASIQLGNDTVRLNTMNRQLLIHDDAQKLVQYIKNIWALIQKYLGITDIRVIYNAIARGTWEDVFDIMKLKDIAVVLSEKALYMEIVNQRLPEVDHAIELAKVYGTNRDLLINQLDRNRERQHLIRENLDVQGMHLQVYKTQQKKYQQLHEIWSEVEKLINQHRDAMTAQVEAGEQANKQESKINQIRDIDSRCKRLDSEIRELDDMIQSRVPMKERMRLDLDAVRRLKIQKLSVERNFTVIDVIRLIMSPGKGIRKELINLYMYDIYQITNQLLLDTFDGKLYLKEFIITDKEFIIPYVYNGVESPDISFASSAQQVTISSALSLAILSKLVDKYGIYTPDEIEGPLNPKAKATYINSLVRWMHYIGITQAIMITQSPKQYETFNVGYLCFPGAELDGKNLNLIEV